MSFSGFTEDDIRKLNKAPEAINAKSLKGGNKAPGKRVTFKPNTSTNSSRTKKFLSNNSYNDIKAQELPEAAKLSTKKINDSHTTEDSVEEIVALQPQEPITNITNEEVGSVPELGQVQPLNEKKFRDLDEFESRQKLIEEQNRKRKELLSKALADRTKRTQEEAQKLNEIQGEFKKLDAVLCADVKILRKQIELASIEYMESQKKYHRIEKDFLEAKLLLHQKKEKKEMLTEHLCTIIEKNEERKATKLNELLQKLDINVGQNNGLVQAENAEVGAGSIRNNEKEKLDNGN